MDREEALQLIRSKIGNKNLVKHMLAVEACMKKLAERFGEDKEKWGLSGLLHDVDYDETKDDFPQHGLVSAKILQEKGIASDIIDAIKAHPGHCPRMSTMAKALYVVDPVTGLIVAAALMHPEKKLRSVSTQFVINRFKEKHFARGANREQIQCCRELGMNLEDFIAICLDAMKDISQELGL